MSIQWTTNSNYLSGVAPTGNCTIITWVRCDTLPSGGSFQGVWSIDNNTTGFLQPYFGDLGGGTIVLGHGFVQTGGAGDLTLITGPLANTWYWLATLYSNGAPGVVYLGQQGGVALQKFTESTNSGALPDTTIYLGNESAKDETLVGQLAGFILYDRLLSEQEIRNQYRQLNPVSRNKLRYYLPLVGKGAPEFVRAGYGSKLTHTGALGWTALAPPVPYFVSNDRSLTIKSQFTTATQTNLITRKLLLGVGT